MSSSAFCIDAAASTVMCLPCVKGGDMATIAYSPAIAASMSVISTPGSSRPNCIGSRWNLNRKRADTQLLGQGFDEAYSKPKTLEPSKTLKCAGEIPHGGTAAGGTPAPPAMI